MRPVYDPSQSGNSMKVVCFVSGSGTNYREIAAGNPGHKYFVFTNRPDCGGVALAQANGHEVIVLNHFQYLKDAIKRYGPGKVPRNCPERIKYEQDVCQLIEDKIGSAPDLICLAGYDQWLTDWMVDKYYTRILNVHPGDTTRGYDGLHWIPSAKAILAGDRTLRSTLFFVDKGEDTGPVLVQSAPLDIIATLQNLEAAGSKGLLESLERVVTFAVNNRTNTYKDFENKADEEMLGLMSHICRNLQEELKVTGDWKIYPMAVDLIGAGRVAVSGRDIYIDGKKMPEYGYRIDADN